MGRWSILGSRLELSEVRDISIKLTFSAMLWFFGIALLYEGYIVWGAIIIHLASLTYFVLLFLFIRQNSNPDSGDKVYFWKKGDAGFPSFSLLKILRNHLLIIGTPIILWSNWWPYSDFVSSHDWENHETSIKKSIGIEKAQLIRFQTSWNDSTTIGKYYLITEVDTTTISLTLSKFDSIIELTFESHP